MLKAYNELLERCGIGETFEGYKKIEGNYLVTYEDKSYHGSPNFIEVNRKELSVLELKVYSSLLSLKKDIVELSNLKEMEAIESEIHLLEAKLKLLKGGY